MAKSRIYVIAGLGFGDEGKGTTVDFIARDRNIRNVVRYNGGPQAAHHVVLNNNNWHCFSQFGSASFAPNSRTHLSHNMLIKPSNFLVERDLLIQKGQADIAQRTSIDPEAHVVTPWHAMLGRMGEVARSSLPHGSVGMGVGKAAHDRRNKNPLALQMHDLTVQSKLRSKLTVLWDEKSAEALKLIEKNPSNKELKNLFLYYEKETSPEILYNNYCETSATFEPLFKSDRDFALTLSSADESIILEGAQGALLDYTHGFFPHVTKTDTSFSSAHAFIQSANLTEVEQHKVGILRAYATRHGAGPFVTEDPSLEEFYPEKHNGTHRWQGNFRFGHFDLIMSRYALDISGQPDYLALTHLDYVGRRDSFCVCDTYLYTGSASQTELEMYFEVEKQGQNTRIKALRMREQPSRVEQTRLCELLNECKPTELIEFSGWPNGAIDQEKTLPEELCMFLDYLESSRGLNCPVKILSFGPRAEDKIWRD